MAHEQATAHISAAFEALGLTKAELARRMGWSWMRLSRALKDGAKSRDCDALCGALGIVFEIPMPAPIPSIFIGRCRAGMAMRERMGA